MLRRDFLKALAATLVVYQSPMLAAANKQPKQPKVVWVMLKGALDPLHTVVPTFEPTLSELRVNLYNSIKNQCLPLDKGFALHPSLVHLHQWYQQKQ